MRNTMWAGAAAVSATLMSALPALADQPRPWQIGFQEAVTPVMHQIVAFHDFVTIIITLIALFVLALLVYVMVKFNENANPSPSRTTHHTLLEIAWTVLPVLILIVIAIPSFRILYAQYQQPSPDLTIKATGNQWFWSYEYPDQQMAFDSVMIEEDKLQQGQPRLLAVDNAVVVPVNKNVQVLVTATDVIHNWAMPAFGVKIDAVPGRVMSTWFRAEKTGIYYGQCSELCGKLHAFMPIEVRVLSEQDYAAWLAQAKQRFAMDGGSTKVAAAAGKTPADGGK